MAFEDYKTKTPKAVSLAVVLKNITSSQALLDHLHHLGNSISYKDTLAVDNKLAHDILEEAERAGIYFPPNILCKELGGGLIQAAADNMDWTEQTMSGNGNHTCHIDGIYQTKKVRFNALIHFSLLYQRVLKAT